jgi:hypothetical protein
MGLYISQTGKRQLPVTGKARALAEDCGAVPVFRVPQRLAELPTGTALVCVIHNGPFDAAGFVYDDRELAGFTDPDDTRPKTWLLMDKELACRLTGYHRRP